MTAAVRTPLRPDDMPSRHKPLAEIPARAGAPYVLEHRGRVIRLAREQATGEIVSIVLAPEDARRVAVALVHAAYQLETNKQ